MSQELKHWSKDIRWLFRPDKSKAVTFVKLFILLIWSWFALIGLMIIFGR